MNKNDIATNDSIQKYLNLAENDTLPFKLRNRYNDRALTFIDLSKNDALTRFHLSCLSFNYVNIREFKKYKKLAKLHLEKSLVAKDTLNIAKYYRYKAGCLKSMFVYDSSFYYYIKAEKLYKKTIDEYGLARVYNNKSYIQYRFDDYLGSNLSAKKAFRYFKRANCFKEQYITLLLIGNTNASLRDYKKAINAFELALNIVKNNNLKTGQGTCLNNIGNVYREQKKYNKAIYYFNLALKEKDLIKKDPCLYGFLLNNLSCCKLQLKDYTGLPNMLFKSIELFKDDEGIKESTISYIYLSNYFLAISDTLKSQLYAQKALKIAKKCNASYYYLTALSNAGSVDSKKASEYIKDYHQKNDSLLFIENNARNQYYTIQLETDDIKQEKETAVKQKWIISFVSGAVVMIIILLLIITRQRSKQKELQLIQARQKANEEIYDLMLAQKNNEEHARQSEKKRIALELHDGVMNKLASTRLNLNVLNYKKDEKTIEKCLIYVADIYQIEQEIRDLSHDLTLEGFNSSNSFAGIINDFISTQNNINSTYFKIEMDETINWGAISSSIKMNLFRIIQEASSNINKFAQAKNAVISLIFDNKNICLSITDDGKGFDIEKHTDGIGLKNIKERVKTLNGKFIIQSINNKSTSINIAIPSA